MSKNSIVPFLKDYLIKFLTRPFLLDTNDIRYLIMREIFELIYPESDGVRCAMKDSKFGYINDKDEIVIPFVYEHAYPFKDNLALVCKDGL